MRAIVQRVSSASVVVKKNIVSSIKSGYLIFLGIYKNDTEDDLIYLINKTSQLRINEDLQGNMNLSILDVKGEILVVSQFTLYANIKKGRRPSFIDAAKPNDANKYYNKYCRALSMLGLNVLTGHFGATMDVHLVNRGPFTIIIDSNNK